MNKRLGNQNLKDMLLMITLIFVMLVTLILVDVFFDPSDILIL